MWRLRRVLWQGGHAGKGQGLCCLTLSLSQLSVFSFLKGGRAAPAQSWGNAGASGSIQKVPPPPTPTLPAPLPPGAVSLVHALRPSPAGHRASGGASVERPLTALPPRAGAGTSACGFHVLLGGGSSRARHQEVRAGAGSFQRQDMHQRELWNFLEMGSHGNS